MKIAPWLLALLVLTGCAAPARGPRPMEPASPTGGNFPDKRVMIAPALNGIIRVQKIQDMSPTQGYLGFQVNVQNLSSSAKTIVYQIDWLDKDGVSLGISMDEPPCTLFKNEILPLAITAPTPLAKDFRLIFRPRGE